MASERWKDDVAYAITPFKLVAWSIGIWPLQVHNVYSLIRYALGITSAVCILSLASMISDARSFKAYAYVKQYLFDITLYENVPTGVYACQTVFRDLFGLH